MELIITENNSLVRKLQEALPAIDKQTKIFNRNNSQTTLTMSTLTLLNGQSPLRMMRQSLAEIEKRKLALAEGQYNLAMKYADIDKLEKKSDKNRVDEAELIKLKVEAETIDSKARGAMKDIACLIDSYENIKANNNIDEWDEETFEAEEKAHHVRRGFELLYRNLIEYGRGKEATIEYLQQYGVHVQMALAEVQGYIQTVNQLVSEKVPLTSLHLEEFLDTMRDKYAKNSDKVSSRIFGKADILNTEYMLLNKKEV